MLIEDGKGRGYKAGVDEENMIIVNSMEITLRHHINHEHGLLFSMPFNDASAAAGADDTLLYILNSSDLDMIIFGLMFGSDTANTWYLKTGVTPTATTGGNITVVTPTNLNAGSGLAAEGTFLTDDGDTMILTGGNETHRWIGEAAKSIEINLLGDVILKKNDTIGLFKVTAGVDTFVGHVIFGYHNGS